MPLRPFPLILRGGKWIRAARPRQLNRHPTSFDTLATTPVSSSLQAPVDFPDFRTGTPTASLASVELRAAPRPKKSFLGVTIPERPTPPKEGGELPFQTCREEGKLMCGYQIAA